MNLQQFYQKRFGGREAYRTKVWAVLVEQYFQKWIKADDVVLDLGAGYGEFINQVICRKKYAMDLNPDTAHKISSEVELLAQNSTDPWPLSNSSLDVVFTSNFFEHLPNMQAFHTTLSEARRCLKPGGMLIALGPNLRYTGQAYWEIEDHHLPLTEQSLVEALTQQGFQIETCIDKFLPFTMASGPHYPTFFVSLYLRLPFAWRIIGKQFLVMGRKL